MTITHRDGVLPGDDGLCVYWRCWQPSDDIRAVVVLSHGMGEHCGRYEHVAEHFCNHGFMLYAFDHRGHGRSPGKRGDVESYGVLLSGVDIVLHMARQENPGKKLFLYGHSFGGQIALNYALRHGQQLSGVISTDAWLRLPFTPPAWKTNLARVLNVLYPSLTLSNELDVTALSRDKSVVDAYTRDPLVHDRISVRMYSEGAIAARYALTHAEYLQVPVLLMHGKGDRITAADGTVEFFDHVGATDRTLKLYDGLFHEIHNEPEKATVLNDMTDWLSKRS